MTITYRLNEPADSVTVDIINNSNVSVATFTAPANRGANQVVWNGTANNGAGAPVAGGTYRVRISASKNAVAWSEVSSNMSVGDYSPKPTIYNSLFDGYSPQDHLFITQTDSDLFGLSFSISSWHIPVAWAGIRFNSDMSTVEGDGYADRILKATPLETKTGPTSGDSYDLWGAAIDPDGDRVYVVGQDQDVGYRIWQGSLSAPAEIVDADPPGLYTSFPREIVISQEGINKYAYITQAGTISKTALNAANGEVLSAPVVITSFSGTRYSKGLALDAQGNLYYTSAGSSNVDGSGGILLRWNASQVAGATPAEPLTEANAVWQVTYSTEMLHMNSVTITPNGQVYTVFAAGTGAGIYNVANISQGAVVKTLNLADRVVDITELGGLNTLSTGLRSDPVGNLAVFDRNLEQIRLYGPSGNNANSIVAPPSQTFTVTSAVDSWSLY
jgi:hypothetical protein